MGDIIHKTISVTSWDKASVERAQSKSNELGLITTAIHEGLVNGYHSFFVVSSGSKEVWDDENEYEDKRRKLCVYMRTMCRNLSWCESVFGHELDTLPYVRDYSESEYGSNAKPTSSIEADKGFEGILMRSHEFSRAVTDLEKALSGAAKALKALCPDRDIASLLLDG